MMRLLLLMRRCSLEGERLWLEPSLGFAFRIYVNVAEFDVIEEAPRR